jgi:Fe-Mn family superoxide dismutase
MKHELPKLPYSFDALEPYIDAKTMEIHYSKHHATYVDNLNKTLDKHPELFDKTLEELLKSPTEIPEDIRTAVVNNAGGVYNHTFFWQVMAAPNAATTNMPSAELLMELEKKFKTFDDFKLAFANAALGRFGSGWAWLVVNPDSSLEILSTANQDSPIAQGKTPILALDVWEHAYYLKYQNRRKDYIEAWWNVVNWAKVNDNYSATK